jgi:hypothetical protein
VDDHGRPQSGDVAEADVCWTERLSAPRMRPLEWYAEEGPTTARSRRYLMPSPDSAIPYCPRIDGVDVEPGATARHSFGLSCRLYRTRGRSHRRPTRRVDRSHAGLRWIRGGRHLRASSGLGSLEAERGLESVTCSPRCVPRRLPRPSQRSVHDWRRTAGDGRFAAVPSSRRQDLTAVGDYLKTIWGLTEWDTQTNLTQTDVSRAGVSRSGVSGPGVSGPGVSGRG